MVEALLANVPLLLLTVGLLLMALEAISPGAHFIVIGVALVGAGLIGVIFPPIASPIILAALTLGIGLAATYIYHEFDFYGGKGQAQTKDSNSLAGTTGYATKEISAREGEVKLDEGGFAPFYSARSTSGTIEEGEEIIVLDPGGGNVLTVESMDAIGQDDIDRELARGAADSAQPEDDEPSSAPSTDSSRAEAEDSSRAAESTPADDVEPERETETSS